MRTNFLALGTGLLAFGLAACGDSPDAMTGPEMTAAADAAAEGTPTTDVEQTLDGRSSLPTIAGIASDIRASNGTVHVIDAVLVP